MTTAELDQWLAGLKPGDAVAIFEHYGRVFFQVSEVMRRTPSGRIVCKGGATFKRDGYLFGNQVYGHRCLRPAPAGV